MFFNSLLAATIFVAAQGLPTINEITSGFDSLSAALQEHEIEAQKFKNWTFAPRPSKSTPPPRLLSVPTNATGVPTTQPRRAFTNQGQGKTWWNTVAPAVLGGLNMSAPSLVPSRYPWILPAIVAPVRLPSNVTRVINGSGPVATELEEQEIASVVTLVGPDSALLQQKLQETAPTEGRARSLFSSAILAHIGLFSAGLTSLQLGLIIAGSVLGFGSLVAVGFLAYRRITKSASPFLPPPGNAAQRCPLGTL